MVENDKNLFGSRAPNPEYRRSQGSLGGVNMKLSRKVGKGIEQSGMNSITCGLKKLLTEMTAYRTGIPRGSQGTDGDQ